MSDSIAALRKDYQLKALSEKDVHSNAIVQFETWWKEAMNGGVPEVNAMTLATSSSDGIPSARIVLLKGVSEAGFVFYTNYNSFKAQQLAENPRACLVFLWKELERQVRVTGVVEKLSAAECDEYFYSRPEGSQISAIASPQSSVISSREWLEARAASVSVQGGDSLKRPDWWGGYLVRPITIEFWQGRSSRLHDRLQYTLEDSGSWKLERLAP